MELFGYLFYILFAVFVTWLAAKRGRDESLWFLATAALTPFIAFVALAIAENFFLPKKGVQPKTHKD